MGFDDPSYQKLRAEILGKVNGTHSTSNGVQAVHPPQPTAEQALRDWRYRVGLLIKKALDDVPEKDRVTVAGFTKEILVDSVVKEAREMLAAQQAPLWPLPPDLTDTDAQEELDKLANRAVEVFCNAYQSDPADDHLSGLTPQERFQELLKLPSPTLYQYEQRYQKMLEAPWPVEKLFCLGCVSLLTAKKGIGKSTLFRTLIICLLQADPFLGRIIQRPVRVLFVPIEGGGMPVIMGFKKSGLDASRGDLAIEDAIPSEAKTLEQRIQWVKAKIVNHRAEVVLIDTLGRFSRIGGNDDYGGTVEIVGELEKVARETGCHIIYAHHVGKNRSDDAELTGAALGSAGIESAAQAHIHLRRRAQGMVTVEIGDMRIGEGIPEHVLDWDADTDLDRLGLPWKDAAAVMLDRAKQALTDFLTNVNPDQWWSITELIAETKGNKRWTGWALSQMYKDDLLDRQGKGVRNSAYQYKLKQNPGAPKEPEQGALY
jgi:AAA domain